MAVAALLSVGITAWALFDLVEANEGYFRMAQFHAHLEVMAIALLLLEGRSELPTAQRVADTTRSTEAPDGRASPDNAT